jgi:SAM-dependent methyltransferase
MGFPTADISQLSPAEITSWPGAERRYPPKSDRHYLVLAALANQIREEAGKRLAGRDDARVLDIGCGEKPYLPFFSSFASDYVGVDVAEGPRVDIVAPAEELPFPDGSFDLVLCTQALEHVAEPGAVLSEIHRVLRPGGTALVSVPSVFLYHPDPPGSDQDYWRWTHSGLRRSVAAAGAWSAVEVRSQGEVVACLGLIVAQFVDELGQRLRLPFLRHAMLFGLNTVAEWLDARFPPRARVPEPGSLTANYLISAVKA